MRQYGLIGFPLVHSFSQKYFSEKFLRSNINDAEFLNFSLPKIEDVENVFKNHPHLQGLAVTIPYKKSITQYLDEVDNIVKKISACNCIKITKERRIGFNTDITGFEKSFIKNLKPEHKKALVLGTGGAAVAVEFVLNKLGIDYLLVSRRAPGTAISYSDINAEILSAYTIIINCTPAGTFPKIDEAPALPYNLLSKKNYLFDLVYNPPLTRFLQNGKEAGCTIQNGYEMLVIQAEENWRIWND
ncbi:MAG: shikimate dehydrogenase [Parafilimonas sp.]|nr:shikimate dehydrogenase [Parafilimonas sp.]